MSDEATALDYRELLAKYLRHIDDCYGFNFVQFANSSWSDVRFTPAELTELERLAQAHTQSPSVR